MAQKMIIEAPPNVLDPAKFPVQRIERQFREGAQGVEDYAQRLAANMARNWGLSIDDLTVQVVEVQ